MKDSYCRVYVLSPFLLWNLLADSPVQTMTCKVLKCSDEFEKAKKIFKHDQLRMLNLAANLLGVKNNNARSNLVRNIVSIYDLMLMKGK